jgi:hypothetical protein
MGKQFLLTYSLPTSTLTPTQLSSNVTDGQMNVFEINNTVKLIEQNGVAVMLQLP